ncbi:prostaglandin F2alpha synthase [Trypanosoma cruzi]|nr:prostaglandin F2alpha synthase [Trypanosoma cruzi]
MATFPELLRPLKLGRYTLRNRIIMAPLTRCQATEDGHVPRTESMLKYYEDRASAGLIIAEATMVQPNYTGVPHGAWHFTPMRRLRSGERSWMRYTKRVALYSCNSFTLGRAGIPEKILQQPKSDQDPLAGRLLAASAIPIKDHRIPAYFAASGEKETYGVPEELTDDEVRNGIIPLFVEGAKNAIFKAGFDGVEIHGANGYLLDAFFRESSNKRQSGPYAGTDHRHTMPTHLRCHQKRLRDPWASDRVGLRISPLNGVHG